MIAREAMRESLAVQEWLQEGRVEGRIEGELTNSRGILTSILADRFPGLDLDAEIRSIGEPQILNDLVLRVVKAGDADEIAAIIRAKARLGRSS
jgi:hypothetical protein